VPFAEPAAPSHSTAGSFWKNTAPRVLALAMLLYAFLVSIGLLGKAFKLMGGGFVEGLIESASNPFVGLFVGILATTLVQSSSTTTSLVVALVGGGTMSVGTAIPVIMGANIGTSVTNTLVSLGHLTRSREFHRAFSASTVHDFFNLCAVAILFPLQVATDFLGRLSDGMARTFHDVGGFSFTSPLKVLTSPSVDAVTGALADNPKTLLLIALALMFGSLRYLVATLKSLVLARVGVAFDRVMFKNAGRAMLLGAVLTMFVQSSSITTSLAVPLAGAGILSLRQVYPYTLGANVGTTATAILASLAVGEVGAVTVAFAHMLFNLCGIAVIWPIRVVREFPLRLATRLADLSLASRAIPILYVVVAFYLIPLLLITLLR
jgi:sodium-dependent phosphate cotransporter